MTDRTSFLLLNALAMAALCWACIEPPGFGPVQHFPLVGEHGEFTCVDCHTEDMTAEPTSCIDCHLEDRPDEHESKGFVGDCGDCHDPLDWSDVEFDHRFPKNHGDPPNACEDCHTDPNDSSAFQCIECHSDKKDLRDEHQGETNNYEYNTAACYNCHPDGRD